MNVIAHVQIRLGLLHKVSTGKLQHAARRVLWLCCIQTVLNAKALGKVGTQSNLILHWYLHTSTYVPQAMNAIQDLQRTLKNGVSATKRTLCAVFVWCHPQQ